MPTEIGDPDFDEALGQTEESGDLGACPAIDDDPLNDLAASGSGDFCLRV